MSIHFFCINTTVTLNKRKKLKQFIEQLIKVEKKKLLSLSIIFCSDEYLLNINRQFLNHDYYTDIITFNLTESLDVIEGEIYISINRITENALLMSVPKNQELHRVIFHGILHLCGYNDTSARQKKLMTSMEDIHLQKYFL